MRLRWPIRALASALPSLWILGLAAAALAQSPTPPAPPLPEGPGVIIGKVVHPADAAGGTARGAGVPVVLYGLSRGGQPGVANTLADANGGFRFEGVANTEDMAYLIGARFGDIPFFGPRIGFAPGATEVSVEIEISDPTSNAADVSVGEVVVQLEAAAGRLAVQELHRLRNDSQAVVLVPEAERGSAQPLFAGRVPAGASDFLPATGGFDDALQAGEDGRVRYWGPVYPGGHDLSFQYRLDARDRQVAWTLRLPEGAESLSLLTSIGGPIIDVASGLALSEPEEMDVEGRSFRVVRAAAVPAGATLDLQVTLPELRNDASALELTRADLWLELDDTQLVVNQDLTLEVSGETAIASDPGAEPLLRVPLPAGVDSADLSLEAAGLGAEVVDGAIVVRGPLAVGSSVLRARYRIPAARPGTRLSFTPGRTLPVLNVLLADTGVLVESERLHRRRPFQSGTRTHLHREAFMIDADEAVHLTVSPLDRSGVGRATSVGFALAAMFGAAFFVIAPLRRGPASSPAGDRDEASTESALQIQRDAVYQDIRDIDHDFETGKLSEEDHRAMRTALRARAVELLRQERAPQAAPIEAPGASSPTAATATASGGDGAVALGAFCPGCGGRIDAAWSFCSHCGGSLGSGDRAG